MMKKILTLLLTIASTVSFGQIPKTIFKEDTEESFNAKDFTISKLPLTQLIGSYHFGESEGEWDLVILSNKDSLIIQVRDGHWDNAAKHWLRNCVTFNEVKTQGNQFKFGKYTGLFVAHNGDTQKAVLLFGDPTQRKIYQKDTAQVGFFDKNLKTYFEEKKYPNLSIKTMASNDLKGKSKQELKYMRNEIFAHYGFIFQNEEITRQFLKTDWYSPWKKDVGTCLSTIEKHNLLLINQIENENLNTEPKSKGFKDQTISGILKTELHYGAPNFGEDTIHDQKVYPYILYLDKQVSLMSEDEEGNAEVHQNVDKIQLTSTNRINFKSAIGKRITITGDFFSGHTGHHYTPVLMNVKQLKTE